MLETSARLLELLSLLQTRKDWVTSDLADRLGVAARTVRRDMARLRTLGYPVHSTPGSAGGYRLEPGARLPPLLFDDEEAVAVALALRTAPSGTVTGVDEPSIRASAKLEQILPSRLRHRLASIAAYTLPAAGSGPKVDVAVLTSIVNACRDREGLRFEYNDHHQRGSRRAVEPHRLVFVNRKWYLVAYDLDRADWRSFRCDRMSLRTPNGPRFHPRQPPADDLTEYVNRGVAGALWACRARVIAHAPPHLVSQRAPATWPLEAIDADHTAIDAGADTAQTLAVYLAALHLDFHVVNPPELTEELRIISSRLAQAAESSTTQPPQ
ncbi:helix-turn-helix transcriptional regulator [Nocardia niigatensis]